jgi:hypothetical protein
MSGRFIHTTFSAVENKYPKDMFGMDTPADAVAKDIGGQVKELFEKNNYSNACALRLSKALNYAGISIPHIPNVTFEGDDKKYYFLAAEKMLHWMESRFGKPDIIIKGSSEGEKLKGNKGLYFMLPLTPNGFGASGHATIYDGSTCPGGDIHCYYNNPAISGGVYRVYLWKMN